MRLREAWVRCRRMWRVRWGSCRLGLSRLMRRWRWSKRRTSRAHMRRSLWIYEADGNNSGPPELKAALNCVENGLEGEAAREFHLAHVTGVGCIAKGTGIGGRVEVVGRVDRVDVGVVEDIERLGTELEPNPFCNWEGLVDCGCKGDLSWTAEDAGLRVAKRSPGRNCERGVAVECRLP